MTCCGRGLREAAMIALNPAALFKRHIEKHFEASETVRDVVIGMADGLTVPFALAAGLSGAVDSTHLVVVAGLAEITAGAIAMGLGGYLAARTEAEHYVAERQREDRHAQRVPRSATGNRQHHQPKCISQGGEHRQTRHRRLVETVAQAANRPGPRAGCDRAGRQVGLRRDEAVGDVHGPDHTFATRSQIKA